jgi:peptidoglycan/LPS O-acetylase OafA/YrhL
VGFHLTGFFTGINAALIAQRGARGHLWIVNADWYTAEFTISSLLICPLLVRFFPAPLGVPTWDFYDTTLEYVLPPFHALWLVMLCSPEAPLSYSKQIFSSKPFKFLGDISYSIYCLHAPILYLAGWAVINKGVNYEAMPAIPEPNTGIAGYWVFPPWAIIPLLVIIIAISAAAHYLVEKPAREYLNKYFDRSG